MSKDLAGSGSGGFVGRPDEDAVDENLFDAGGELLRFGEGGAIDDGCGVEEYEVGVSAFTEDAAIGPVEALRGERSHFADGCRKSEPMFFAYEAAEHARESSGTAWVS